MAGLIGLLREEGRSAERAARARAPSAREILAAVEPIRGRAEERRALWPIVWLERVAAAVGAMAALGVGWWLLRRVGDSAARALARTGADFPPPPVDPVSVSILVTAVAVLAVAVYGLMGLAGPTADRTRRRW